MSTDSYSAAISRFGADARAKLRNTAVEGAPEDQLRAPLEAFIKDIAAAAAIGSSVHLVGETTLSHLRIRPDYAVTIDNVLIGYIEVKAPGKGADPRRFSSPHDKAQWARLKALPNLLYTDGNAFGVWKDGELHGKVISFDGDIETAGASLTAPASLIPLLVEFLTWGPTAPANAKRLAEMAARLCRLLRDEVVEEIEAGNEHLALLQNDWRALLFPNASAEQFADGYAQAVTFGLLIARAYDVELVNGIEMAALRLKKSNSLIGTALTLLTESAETQAVLKTSLGALTRVLSVVNWHTISRDKAEAWLYFYEEFLEVYDNRLKKLTGSYYTPPPVVDAMIRLVDEALKGPLFQRAAGLASQDVTLADPAVGTGTFLLGILRRIALNVEADQGAGAVPGAIAAACGRLVGFELQFGPFAVAQLRLVAELRSLMPDVSTPPAMNLFITNTLDNPFVEDEHLPQVVEAVAKARREANRIKREKPITVVIGNPPYKNKAAGLGKWIESGSDGYPSPLSRWEPPVTWGLGSHTHHLKNLYVYFWRWATLKVFGSGWQVATGLKEERRSGLVCYITASGFIAGPAFEKMREDLRRDAHDIWVINCTPEGQQPDVSTRLFPTVQQPICIVLVGRGPEKVDDLPARLHYLALPVGHRKVKFARLENLTLHDPEWRDGPSGWRDPFGPNSGSDWPSFPLLKGIFATSFPGVTPHRTWPIAADEETLRRRWDTLRRTKDIEAKSKLFSPDRDRTITKNVRVQLGINEVRPVSVKDDDGEIIDPRRYAFRSFDRQWIIPDHRLLSMARPVLWSIASSRQIFLTGIERASPTAGPAISFTDLVPDHDHYNGRGGRVYTLYADAAATTPNVRPDLLTLLAAAYGAPVSAEDVVAYIAAVMAHPAFTARFKADLVRPGLRLPLTADAELFARAVAVGHEVVWLHCYGERFVDVAAGRPKGPPRMAKEASPHIPREGAIPSAPEPLPDTIDFDAGTRRLIVGKGFVANVTPAMWAYEVSGKAVLRQWFSYRKRDRSRPIIGDRRPPSPLEQIQPESWPASYTEDLLNLLHVLGRLIALEPAQAALLEEICAAARIPAAALRAAGLLEGEADAETVENDPEAVEESAAAD